MKNQKFNKYKVLTHNMDKILVLDFGGQYCHLIARRIRALNVYSEVAAPTVTNFRDVKGIILSGGPSSVFSVRAPEFNPNVFKQNIPILGICYGHQLIAHYFGGRVIPLPIKEYGKSILEIKDHRDLFKGLGKKEIVWMSHGDTIEKVPLGFTVLASTKNCPIAAIADRKKKIFSTQFHPEVTHTKHGQDILRNFVFNVCKLKPNWNPGNLVNRLITQIKKEVKKNRVLMAASGGVDSTVAAVLLHKALGDKVYYVFVDNGLIRHKEVENVINVFKKQKMKNLFIIDARKVFLKNLKGIVDPEEKRKIISETFFDIFQRKAKLLSKKYKIKFLGQGTIYPDRIETAQPSASADKIKSHHNVLLPQWLKLRLVEPLRDFYKDEVRDIGKKLKLPKGLVGRHPFPGPGLGVRILGQITEKKIEFYKEIDFLITNILKKTKWYDKLWMGFPVLVPIREFENAVEKDNIVGYSTNERLILVNKANELVKRILQENNVKYDVLKTIFLPVKSVGVMGDARTYESPICLRILRRNKIAKLPYNVLENVSNELINKIKGVNRVVYDITQEPRGWDNVIAVRAVTSLDAMTCDWAKFEYELLDKISKKIMEKEKIINRVVYDITQKPPGTMEWE